MALHYNLSKVYSISESEPEIVNKTVSLFVNETPIYLSKIKKSINKKDYNNVFEYANKIKLILDLLGLNIAFQEALQLEAWTEYKGSKKAIKENFKSIKNQVNQAIKELKKDFRL